MNLSKVNTDNAHATSEKVDPPYLKACMKV